MHMAKIVLHIKLTKLTILVQSCKITTTTILPHIIFHILESYHTGHHEHTDEKTQHSHVFVPCLVVQRHTGLHNGPSQQVLLILHTHARACRAAGGKQAACITGCGLHITIKRYGGEGVDGILSWVHPVQPDPKIWNLRFRDHKTRRHVPGKEIGSKLKLRGYIIHTNKYD